MIALCFCFARYYSLSSSESIVAVQMSSFSSPRWYHLQSLSSEVLFVSPLRGQTTSVLLFCTSDSVIFSTFSLSLVLSFLTWSLSVSAIGDTCQVWTLARDRRTVPTLQILLYHTCRESNKLLHTSTY